ncbi:MAG: SMC-Scp complex subunit ScpB [Myxococcota bacterium]
MTAETPPRGPKAGPGLEKAVAQPTRDPARLESVLESLVFVADKPITERQLAKLSGRPLPEVREALARLEERYEGRGVELQAVAGGYQFRSAAANAAFVRELVARRPVRLTRAQLETLSIVSYRQPVTRPEVDEIRGVDSGSALKVLSERGLLRVLGRKDEPGRPLLYGTSKLFLEFFGLKSLGDLPTLKEFTELSDESRGIFERRMGEPLDLAGVEAQAQAAEAAAQEELLLGDEAEDGDAEDEAPEGQDTAADPAETTDGDDSDGDDPDGDDSDEDDD